MLSRPSWETVSMSDGIVLVGLPGSGKSTVGAAVAQRLGRQFIDIDAEVQRASGCSPAEILEREGEARLRELEREAVLTAVKSSGPVIATGGGTVLDPMNRWLLMEHGKRIRLDVPTQELARRLQAQDSTPRPLLGDDLVAGLERTAKARAGVYAAVDAAVDASGPIEAVVDEVVAARPAGGWRPLLERDFTRHHPIGPTTGRLRMGRGFDPELVDVGGSPAFLVDRNAPLLVTDAVRIFRVPGGEQIKTMEHLQHVLTWLARINAERTDPLVVVGGGTLGDLGGLAAALHRRGVPLVHVPTTWLAQTDSAIGGKVAIDLGTAKNGVGAFWPATLVVEDADVLRTLPPERRRDGMAESLKAGLIGDPALWQLVERRGVAALDGEDDAARYAIIERAVRVKLDIVDRDPFETGERRRLNLGHTLGHALEIESGYTLSHGAAVALGLRAVAVIASRRGAQPDFAERIDAVLDELGFALRRDFDRATVLNALRGDKKREAGAQRWILPMAVGEVAEVSDVSEAELNAAMDAIAA
jgi:shikimate kinase/3-dehydroquinate synthase